MDMPAEYATVPHEQFIPDNTKHPSEFFRGIFSGKALALFSVVILGAGLIGGVYLSQQQQNTQQHASAVSDVIGYLDGRTTPSTWCTAIYGWACDRTNPSLPITVHLYSPNPYVAGGPGPVDGEVASLPSGDEAAIASFCGATTGNKKSYPHRFVLHIPTRLKTNTPIKVYVYGIGLDGVHNPLLVGSGTTITCAPPTPTATPKPTATPTLTPTATPNPSVSPTQKPSGAPLEGDVNNDGKIDILDYNLIMGCYGANPTDACTTSDINKDGVIDGIDYNIFLRAYIQANQ